MNYSGKTYTDLCDKNSSNLKWCYRCPNNSCTKKNKSYVISGFNEDGRYMYTKEGGGFTAIKTHMQKCITLERCVELFKGEKKQRKLVESKPGETSVYHRVILNFIELIVDENIPLWCCNKKKFRNILYRGESVHEKKRLCTKTLSKIMHERANLVQAKVAKEMVSNVFKCFWNRI